jgi:hypothetical protein
VGTVSPPFAAIPQREVITVLLLSGGDAIKKVLLILITFTP